MFCGEALSLPGCLISVMSCVDAQSNLEAGQVKQTTIESAVCFQIRELVCVCAWLCLNFTRAQ